jgi:alkylation response protein AidB-like acyl-CoA dehydrogenase
MSPAQRERFLPQFLEDDRYHLAFASEEPDSERTLGINYHRPTGRDTTLRTTATRSGGGEWVINGAKDCVANAPLAKLFAVTVQAGDGMRIVLVPRDAPGLTVTAHDGADRWFHGACGTVTLHECRIPAQYVIETSDDDPLGRDDGCEPPFRAAISLGIGRAAQEAALDYAQLRVQGGRPIVEHQAIGVKLAEIAIRLDVARNAVWRAAWASDNPDAFADRSLPDLPLSTVANAFTFEAVHRAAKDAAECFGAMGVMRDMPLHKHVRDALISLHSGGGSSDTKLAIAEALVGYRPSAAPSMRAAE